MRMNILVNFVLAFVLLSLITVEQCGADTELYVTFGPCRAEFYASGMGICVTEKVYTEGGPTTYEFNDPWLRCNSFTYYYDDSSVTPPNCPSSDLKKTRLFDILDENNVTVASNLPIIDTIMGRSAGRYYSGDDPCFSTIYPAPSSAVSVESEYGYFLDSRGVSLTAGTKYKVMPHMEGLRTTNTHVIDSPLFVAKEWTNSPNIVVQKKSGEKWHDTILIGCENVLSVFPTSGQTLWGIISIDFSPSGDSYWSHDGNYTGAFFQCPDANCDPKKNCGDDVFMRQTVGLVGVLNISTYFDKGIVDMTNATTFDSLENTGEPCEHNDQCENMCGLSWCAASDTSTNYCRNKREGDEPMCFIATAAFGTTSDPRLSILRYWRDTSLLTNPLGRRFVAAYYATSPPVADFIRQHDSLRAVVRWTVVYPALFYIQNVRSWVGMVWLIAVFLLISGATLMVVMKRQKS